MLIIVTGTSGCLGSALVGVLSELDSEIVSIHRSNEYRKSDDNDSQKNVTEVFCDLSSGFDFSVLPEKCDAVIHLAQSRNYRDFPGYAHEIFSINASATFGLAEYARQAGATHFVYSSSGSVYIPQSEPVSETAITAPSNFYAATKMAAENLLSPYSDYMNVFLPRLFYMYGPNQKDAIVAIIANRINYGQEVQLHGESGIQLTPTYSEDVARIIGQALDENWQGVYNIANSKIVSLKFLAQEIGHVLDKEPRFSHIDDKPPIGLIPNVDLLNSRIDLNNLTSLEDGLKATFRDNR